MNKVKIFAIYDNQAETFGRPFFMLTEGLAIRGFVEAASDPQTDFAKFPSDFILYEIGDYDENTGLIESIDPKRHMSALTALNTVGIKNEHYPDTEETKS